MTATTTEERERRLTEYVDRVVAAAPPLTREQIDNLSALLRQGPVGSVRQESPRVLAIRKAEVGLANVRTKFREALEGCHGCGLSRKVHQYQKGYGTGYHAFVDLSPEGAIKVAQVYKKKITAAEKALEVARLM